MLGQISENVTDAVMQCFDEQSSKQMMGITEDEWNLGK